MDQARADLESALPLVTGNPTVTVDDLLRKFSERGRLESLSDGELLRQAGREAAIAAYVVANAMLRREAEALVRTSPGAVAVLVRALAECVLEARRAIVQSLEMEPLSPKT